MKIRSVLVIAVLGAVLSATTALAASPPVSGATRVALGDTVTTTTTDTDPSYICTSTFTIYYAIGFTWKATVTQSVRADTIGSGFDTKLCVIDRSKGQNTVVGYDDDAGGSFTSLVNFSATKGHTYYFVVGGYSDSSSYYGSLTFHLTAVT